MSESEGGKSSYMGLLRLDGYQLHRRLDLKLYPEEQLPFALLYFTGSDHFNRSMRHFAKQKGYTLSDRGIMLKAPAHARSPGGLGNERGLVNARDEADIFAALGLEYVPPTERNCVVSAADGRAIGEGGEQASAAGAGSGAQSSEGDESDRS